MTNSQSSYTSNNFPAVVNDGISKLTAEQQMHFSKEFNRRKKKTGIAYLFWLINCQYFYFGNIALGLAYFFTAGFLFVGMFWELFAIPSQVKKYNADLALLVLKDVKTLV